ncbi:hypothetical protein [Krasilnikovia sp. MM14-A1259]|uniref:hypothetical protein n=1 Tax=Krasilnikovia sp. MM14-A1259 TaxID=3373539 RepID=UPI003800E22F
MYAWIWRKLPGGLWAKLTGSVALTAAVGLLLWYFVFPWATPLLPFDDVQVGTNSSEQTGPAQQDPNAVPGADDPGLGPDDIPYSTHSNQPEPSPSKR